MKYLPLILLITLSSCTTYTTQDKIACGAFLITASTDVWSTSYALNNDCRELNQLLNEYPSDEELILFKAGMFGVFFTLGEIWPEHRETFYWIGSVFQGGASIHNFIEAN